MRAHLPLALFLALSASLPSTAAPTKAAVAVKAPKTLKTNPAKPAPAPAAKAAPAKTNATKPAAKPAPGRRAKIATVANRARTSPAALGRGASGNRAAVARKLNWAAPAAAGAVAAAEYASAGGALGDDVGLIINNRALSKNEVRQELALLRRTAPAGIPEKQLLEELIRRQLLQELATRNDISVSDEEIDGALAEVAAKNQLSTGALLQKLQREMGLNAVEYRRHLAQSLLEEKMKMEAVAPEISVREEEIDDQIAQLAYKADTTLQVEDLLLPLPAGTPEQRGPLIQKLLQQVSGALRQTHNNLQAAAQLLPNARFNSLGQVNLLQAPPRFARVLANLPVGEVSATPVIDSDGMHFLRVAARAAGGEEGKAVKTTEADVAQILVRGHDAGAKEKIEAIYRQLQGGANFASLAQRYSEDSASAAKGGEMGYVNAEELGEEFGQALERAPLGQVLPPFETPFGWHLIRVKDRRQVDASEALLRQRIRVGLFMQRLEEKWQQNLQNLRQGAFVKVNL